MPDAASASSARARGVAHRDALFAMIGATLLWGGTFVAIRDSVAAVPPATARLARGIAIALGGVALLSLRTGFALGSGETWTLAGAALFALQVVAVARFARGCDPAALVCVQSFVAAAILAPFAGPPARA